jgi:HSP20 family molecular chaperone IbpA
VPLPSGLDLDAAEAHVQKGVLTVRFPRKEGHANVRRVPIKEAE